MNNLESHLETFNSMSIFYILVKKCMLGEMEYADLIVFNKYINEFEDSLNYLLHLISHTLYGLLEWKKFLEFYDIKPKIFSKENPITPENKGLNIEFKNVNFSYPTKSEVKIFENLSFKIPSNKRKYFIRC